MAKGFSLHIGLNSVDPNHYDGWDGQLVACENDAQDMHSLAQSQGYGSRKILLTKQATRNAVTKELTRLSKAMKKGDILLLTYSGHGGQLPDKNNDENDHQDETWVLYDGEIVDDELYNLYSKFADGVRIVILSDSCHSGSVSRDAHYMRTYGSEKRRYRFMPSSVALRTYLKNKKFYDKILTQQAGGDSNPKKKTFSATLKASVRLISGCMDNQLSSDGDFNGLFTGTLLQIWNNATYSGTYTKFVRDIRRQMPPDQTPRHYLIGKHNAAFNKQRPFEI